MSSISEQIEEHISGLGKIIFSNPVESDEKSLRKIQIVKIKSGTGFVFQSQEFTKTQAFHKNLKPDELLSYADNLWKNQLFRQVNLLCDSMDICIRISKKGKETITVDRKNKTAAIPLDHNKEKNYLINEGDQVPFLVDLGVFTKDYKVASAYYDKFRQINRFLEILDHAFKEYNKDSISVLDFGCGKSYLTFFVYYYFREIRKINVRIIGYDLKEDVVRECNRLAETYGYDKLQFVVADVTKDRLSEEQMDMVISLHACDVATDYALFYALKHNVSYIFSVPCCQHEINNSIQKGSGDCDIFLKYGIVKDRFSALLTDSIRAEVIERYGYSVDMLEFVDFTHTPKNIMIRARKKLGYKHRGYDDLTELENKYHFHQTLLHLVMEEETKNGRDRKPEYRE